MGISINNGKIVIKDTGSVGSGQNCCCNDNPYQCACLVYNQKFLAFDSCDIMESQIGAIDISMTPTRVCTGENFTISFTIRNETGGTWTSTTDDFYVYLAILNDYNNGSCGVCSDIEYISASPAPFRTNMSGGVVSCAIMQLDWSVNLANNAEASYSATFRMGDVCNCTDPVIFEVSVVRGCRANLEAICDDCVEDPSPSSCAICEACCNQDGEVTITIGDKTYSFRLTLTKFDDCDGPPGPFGLYPCLCWELASWTVSSQIPSCMSDDPGIGACSPSGIMVGFYMSCSKSSSSTVIYRWGFYYYLLKSLDVIFCDDYGYFNYLLCPQNICSFGNLGFGPSGTCPLPTSDSGTGFTAPFWSYPPPSPPTNTDCAWSISATCGTTVVFPTQTIPEYEFLPPYLQQNSVSNSIEHVNNSEIKNMEENQIRENVIGAIESLKQEGVSIQDFDSPEKIEGFGDKVANVLSSFGLTQDYLQTALGFGWGCGCNERKSFLNKIFSFTSSKKE